MSVKTLKSSELIAAVFQPPTTGRKDSFADFGKMRLDDDYYHRAHALCKATTGSEFICRQDIPVDSCITPQNPTESVFAKELVDSIECMTQHLDSSKCYHFTSSLHKKLNWEDPKPTARQSATEFVSKLVFGIPESKDTK
eukprot:GHVL01004303.1.p1 GENE.GHVL01004303.1~~GHVL01004303.1.p1  ORF type:complete len:140 (+),score=11.35 GHVL01004303.1:41-460(+)